MMEGPPQDDGVSMGDSTTGRIHKRLRVPSATKYCIQRNGLVCSPLGIALGEVIKTKCVKRTGKRYTSSEARCRANRIIRDDLKAVMDSEIGPPAFRAHPPVKYAGRSVQYDYYTPRQLIQFYRSPASRAVSAKASMQTRWTCSWRSLRASPSVGRSSWTA